MCCINSLFIFILFVFSHLSFEFLKSSTHRLQRKTNLQYIEIKISIIIIDIENQNPKHKFPHIVTPTHICTQLLSHPGKTASADFVPAATLTNLANCYSRSGNVSLAELSIKAALKLVKQIDAKTLNIHATILTTGIAFERRCACIYFVKKLASKIKFKECHNNKWTK
jgi:hypothetical protein